MGFTSFLPLFLTIYTYSYWPQTSPPSPKPQRFPLNSCNDPAPKGTTPFLFVFSNIVEYMFPVVAENVSVEMGGTTGVSDQGVMREERLLEFASGWLRRNGFQRHILSELALGYRTVNARGWRRIAAKSSRPHILRYAHANRIEQRYKLRLGTQRTQDEQKTTRECPSKGERLNKYDWLT